MIFPLSLQCCTEHVVQSMLRTMLFWTCWTKYVEYNLQCCCGVVQSLMSTMLLWYCAKYDEYYVVVVLSKVCWEQFCSGYVEQSMLSTMLLWCWVGFSSTIPWCWAWYFLWAVCGVEYNPLISHLIHRRLSQKPSQPKPITLSQVGFIITNLSLALPSGEPPKYIIWNNSVNWIELDLRHILNYYNLIPAYMHQYI